MSGDLRGVCENESMQAGLDLGLRLIDTAEMYADGAAEEIVGEALAGRRDGAFLVSKVYPWNAGGQKAIAACEGSLRRLKTDYLDLYLLHWTGDFTYEETVSPWKNSSLRGKFVGGVFRISIMTRCRRYGRLQVDDNAPLTRCYII